MISFVIPVFNEKENIAFLIDETISVLKKGKTNEFEILIVSDGSTDGTNEIIKKLVKTYKWVKGIIFRCRQGKASALTTGFEKACGDIIVTLDGDGQDDPHQLHKLLKELDKGYDMVSGWKKNRKDSFIKNTSSLIFNRVVSFFTKLNLHDYNSGFKAYKKGAAKSLKLYGELHRYIPLFLDSYGYKVTEVRIDHRRRFHGNSKYSWERFFHGYFDLFTMLLVTRFHSRPLHFFGYIGFIFFSLGFAGGAYLTLLKIFSGQTIGSRPLLLLSVMLIIMGVQITITGLIGEYITYILKNKPEKPDDLVKEQYGFNK